MNTIAHNQIIEILCAESGFSFPQILEKNRKKEVKAARQILHYFLYAHCRLKVKYIGYITQRDHTTVVHSKALVIDMVKNNDRLYMHLYNKVLVRVERLK